MIRSMTAFARVQSQGDAALLCWEIRSVNHRYLETYFRLPEPLRFLETELRQQLRMGCSRGKFECQLKLTECGAQKQNIRVNESLVDALMAAGESLAHKKHLSNDLTFSSLINWPGVIEISQPDMEGVGKEAILLFNQAITALNEARKSEGLALAHHLKTRLQRMQDEIVKARAFADSTLVSGREKLMARLQNLELDVDHHRVEQEIALMLTRLDVSEELDRLGVHLLEVQRILGDTESAGRRLDFLMQELNREANTLSSKSDSTALTQCAIEMKVLIEQMREQIQNIE